MNRDDTAQRNAAPRCSKRNAGLIGRIVEGGGSPSTASWPKGDKADDAGTHAVLTSVVAFATTGEQGHKRKSLEPDLSAAPTSDSIAAAGAMQRDGPPSRSGSIAQWSAFAATTTPDFVRITSPVVVVFIQSLEFLLAS
ncbi:hypothetical protein RA307_22030 [Xanthobacteraceae bacterium Astr-EGSB]|uniref:hypothetical protein n=1 Tax=Astrobacterium formosum TaxID=3069710 RepID=UPI0027ADCF49|nr:hypothetical protein [Xanthobacteraceae bacterium Astr-EGSB]